jgi:nitrite reductase/ring-hydroxylating ferredoxin subunit
VPQYVVGRTDEVPPGSRKIVNVNGRSIGIFNVDGEYFAVRNVCPHQGGPLCAGVVWSQVASSGPGEYEIDAQRKLVRCPWHGWEFELSTGRSWFDPSRTRVRRYAINVVPSGEVVGAGELVEGPYRAETYPVRSNGGDLIVVVT